MKIVVGTYEGNLLGWESDYAADASGCTLGLAYAFNAHDASVKCLAMDQGAGNALVSGSNDETVRVYNLKSHREMGSLLEHKDALTAAQFCGAANMVSGDKSGALCIWRCSDWLALDRLRGHKGAINGVAIHPSGRLALSVSADKSLRMWDLTKGKPAFRLPLDTEGLGVKWNADGTRYAIMYDTKVCVYDGGSGKKLHTLAAPAKALDFVYVPAAMMSEASEGSEEGKELIVIACEGGGANLAVWAADGSAGHVINTGHGKRVRACALSDGPKALAVGATPAAARAAAEGLHPLSRLQDAVKAKTVLPCSGPMLVSADSDCFVKVWSVASLVPGSGAAKKADGETLTLGGVTVPVVTLEPLATLTAGVGSRPTALAVSNNAAGKRSGGAPGELSAERASASASAGGSGKTGGAGSSSGGGSSSGAVAGAKRPRPEVEKESAAAAVPPPKKAKVEEAAAPAPAPKVAFKVKNKVRFS